MAIMTFPALAKKSTHFFNEDEPIHVKVSKTSMVRISVKGDRLQDVYGLDENTLLEKDETHGFLYLKNCDKTLTLTVVTEGGQFQDLVLEPDDHGTTSLVLERKGEFKTNAAAPYHSLPSPNFSSYFAQSSAQESALFLMKKLHGGEGTTDDLITIENRKNHQGLTATPIRILLTDLGLKGIVFEIKNDNAAEEITFLAKEFYESSDVALSSLKQHLLPGESTFLFVVTQIVGVR